ncbi:HNH endonuclease (plasmid) [Skermanella rosea]|uniref:HNH endonuclease n=1 Tax=Skermanella rosea TaxID=1817965 RepID=UPI001934724B|nr:HNH endonuclease [Skermanella rosea]UEM08242.1 HNH endonuclease [Skermanella rosea]
MGKAIICPECGNDFIRKPRSPAQYCSVVCKFWSLVDRSGGPDACWPWMGWKGPLGYGSVPDNLADGKRTSAHRRAYFLHYGVDPGKLSVCHRCDNPSCANPAHLWLGTHQQNLMDGVQKGRISVAAPGAANFRSKLDEAQVRAILKSPEPGIALARRFGVSRSAISLIRTRVTWRHVWQAIEAEVAQHQAPLRVRESCRDSPRAG